jgi:molecular chaperone Hsp33
MTAPEPGGPIDAVRGIPADDVVLPFQIDPFALRGRLVRIGPVVDSIVRQHAYPPPVAAALAEMIALASALALTLKYDGVFTVQTKGDGPVRLMVADVTSAGDVRGYAQFDSQRIARMTDPSPSVPRLFGAGHLAFTVDQGDNTERYQGIVELTGPSLAECAHHYFRQSEQLQAGLKIAAAPYVDAAGEQHWRAGALMIQRLPEASIAADDDAEEGWRRAMILMGSATSAELVDPGLLPWRLIDRLFLAEGVRIYRPHALRARCRCSRERMARVLAMIPRVEIDAMKIDGRVVVTCEFCSASHAFDERDLARLPAATAS